mmetsp:Transcript_61795/g.93328  ORF Transcript_61795/g.93328 Transcript_61795/m.93328 type:complete len:402 (+) Transcript_61795:57-1262(+)|eukprot:CAMPEP_0117034400 /NCGR_PEP_ID=MMETSP0472-20121206/24495_1 /TAXON_ID=693140 ORGANISM="Tiarina fusus, Strain LIS" /NCGR_SAMPLE_ID=MMETSP0472 /ASSEMBLY_ACC=CAM_ASM_000603 /LENGTH=401 /DNA_ID=CAMNT_0004743561 /DNA_START=57 /DNA_END=1262 /DNA_ORIENTATION=+
MTDSRTTACALLQQAHNEFDIEYGGFLSNHIAHGIITLERLEASPERITSWYEEYKKHYVLGHQLEPAQETCDLTITSDNWKTFEGKRKYFPDLYQFFKKELENSTEEEFINKFVPELARGLAGSALHPVIHLGFSIDFGHFDVPLAEGVAYLTHSYLPLTDYRKFNPSSVPNDQICDLKSVVVQVQKDTELWNLLRTTNEEGFQSKLKLLKDSERLLHYTSKWSPLHKNPESESEKNELFDAACKELAQVATFAFYYTNPPCKEFFLLHGVTACYATICITKLLKNYEDRMEFLFYYVFSFLGVFVVEGSTDVVACSEDPEFPVSPVEDWDAITREVTDVNTNKHDVHMLKLVYVCKRFSELFGPDPLWVNAAGCLAFSDILDTKDFEFGLGLKQDSSLR